MTLFAFNWELIKLFVAGFYFLGSWGLNNRNLAHVRQDLYHWAAFYLLSVFVCTCMCVCRGQCATMTVFLCGCLAWWVCIAVSTALEFLRLDLSCTVWLWTRDPPALVSWVGGVLGRHKHRKVNVHLESLLTCYMRCLGWHLSERICLHWTGMSWLNMYKLS